MGGEQIDAANNAIERLEAEVKAIKLQNQAQQIVINGLKGDIEKLQGLAHCLHLFVDVYEGKVLDKVAAQVLIRKYAKRSEAVGQSIIEIQDALKPKSEPECDCLVPALDGAGQHSPSCAIFKKRPGEPMLTMSGCGHTVKAKDALCPKCGV